MLSGHAGSDDIDAVEALLFHDLFDPALPGEIAVGHLDVEVLGHLLAVENRTNRDADLGGAAQRRVFALNLCLNAGKFAFGRGQQILAFARSLSCQIAIATDDQPLAWEHVGGADFGEIAVIEQRQLQRPILRRQSLDRRRAQAGDPIDARRLEIIADACRGDHSSIPDQHHTADPEAILDLLDLRTQRLRIGRVAVKDFNRNRQPLTRTEQPVDNLRPVAPVIAAMAIVRQRTAAALKVRRTDVVEHQHAVLEMSPRQAGLNPRLALDQPIERLIGLALLHLAQAQSRSEAGDCRLLIHRPHKAKLRAWRNQPINDHGYHQIAMAPRCLILLRRAQNQPIQRNLADRPKRRCNMAVRQRTLDLNLVRSGTNHRAALEQRPQSANQIPRQLAQIGQGPLLRAAMLVAIAIPQQHRSRRTSIGNRLDEHSRIESHLERFGNPVTWIQTGSHLPPNSPKGFVFRVKPSANFGLEASPPALEASCRSSSFERLPMLKFCYGVLIAATIAAAIGPASAQQPATPAAPAASSDTGQSTAPAGAYSYFANLKNGDTVTSPFKVVFG